MRDIIDLEATYAKINGNPLIDQNTIGPLVDEIPEDDLEDDEPEEELDEEEDEDGELPVIQATCKAIASFSSSSSIWLCAV